MAEKKQYLDYKGLSKVLTKEHAYVNSKIKAASDAGDVKYVPAKALVAATSLTTDHGGVSGKSAADLNGKSISELMDDILFPTKQPTVPSDMPSLSFSYSGTNPVEAGTVLPTVNDSKFTTSTARGTVEYNTSDGTNNYAGAPGTVTISCASAGVAAEADQSYTYQASVTFASGGTLKDNKGKDATVASYAEGTKTANVTIKAYYAIWANSADITATNKVGLATTTSIEIEFPAETADNKYTLEIPTGYSLTKWEVYDADSKAYKTQSAAFVKVTVDGTAKVVEHTAGGTLKVNYNLYVRTLDSTNKMGANKVKFTFTKG